MDASFARFKNHTANHQKIKLGRSKTYKMFAVENISSGISSSTNTPGLLNLSADPFITSPRQKRAIDDDISDNGHDLEKRLKIQPQKANDEPSDAAPKAQSSSSSSSPIEHSQDELRAMAHPSVPLGLRLKMRRGYVVPEECEEVIDMPLAKKYQHPRDLEICFLDNGTMHDEQWNPILDYLGKPLVRNFHMYFICGIKVGKSVTGFVHMFADDFDSTKIINAMIQRPDFPMAPKYEKYRSLPMYYDPVEQQAQSAARNTNILLKLIAKIKPPPSCEDGWGVDEQSQESSYEIKLSSWRPGMILTPDTKLVHSLIEAQWESNRNQASSDGTAMHLCCEYYMNEFGPVSESLGEIKMQLVNNNQSKEFGFFKRYFEDMKARGWVPYKTEQIVWDTDIDLCGSVDAQFQRIEDVDKPATPEHPKRIMLVDWKRSKQIKLNHPFGKRLKEPFQEFEDCSRVTYSLQLQLYRWFLEKHYDVKVEKMFILQFHPDNDNNSYKEFEALPIGPLVSEALDRRRNEVAMRSK